MDDATPTPGHSGQQRLLAHVTRYPRWYAAAAVWLLAMLVLPVVEPLTSAGDPVERAARPVVPVGAPAPPTSAPPAALPPPESPTGAFSIPSPPAAGGFDAEGPHEPPGDGGPPPTVPPEDAPPDPWDFVFGLVPPLPAPPEAPAELQPLLHAVAPLASQGCSALGLASLVIAVAAPTVQEVPLERILPYLAPVTAACANFPVQLQHTVCAIDEPLVADVGGVTTTPPVIGLGIDVIAGFEAALERTYGAGSVPRLSEQLRTVLSCRVVTR